MPALPGPKNFAGLPVRPSTAPDQLPLQRTPRAPILNPPTAHQPPCLFHGGRAQADRPQRQLVTHKAALNVHGLAHNALRPLVA